LAILKIAVVPSKLSKVALNVWPSVDRHVRGVAGAGNCAVNGAMHNHHTPH
jgi:hypothetical protein